MSVSYKDFCTLIKLKVPKNSPCKLALPVEPLSLINSEPSLLELQFRSQPNLAFQLSELVSQWRILDSEQTKLILEHASFNLFDAFYNLDTDSKGFVTRDDIRQAMLCPNRLDLPVVADAASFLHIYPIRFSDFSKMISPVSE